MEGSGDRFGVSLIEIAVAGASFTTASLVNLLSYRLYDIKIVDPYHLLIGGVSTIAYAVADSVVRTGTGKSLTERAIEASYSLYKKLSEML